MPSIDFVKAAIHYYHSEEPFFLTDGAGNKQPRQGTGDSKYQATIDLRNAGLIIEVEFCASLRYRPTDGLRLYIEALTKVPLPKQEWTMPRPPVLR